MALPKEMTEGGDLTEFWLNQQKLEEQRKFLGLPTYEEQMKRQAEGQTPVTPLEAFSAIARPIESVTGAPTRAAAKALSEGKGFGDAFAAFKEQFGKNPETAPTGEELASSVVPYGASPKLLGLGLDVTLDPSNLLGPGLAAGAAIGGLKRLRTAAEIATDIERLAPQNPLGFYSKLERALVEALPPTGTVAPGQVKNIAATQKAEEVAQTGLIPWLESKQTFTRNDLLEYLAQNRLDLSEIVRAPDPVALAYEKHLDKVVEAERAFLEKAKTQGLSRSDAIDFLIRMNEAPSMGQQNFKSRQAAAFAELPEALRPEAQAFNELYQARETLPRFSKKEVNTPKYERYSLPGGSEYQETQFIFNPKDNPAGLARRQAVFDKYQPELDRLRKEINSLDYATRVAAHKKYDELVYKRYKEADEAYSLVADQEPFISSHWSEKNTMAHARTQKFKNTEGETVFLVDELQSDWHQKGRGRGYRQESEKPTRAEAAKPPEPNELKIQEDEHQFKITFDRLPESSVTVGKGIVGDKTGAIEYATEFFAEELQRKQQQIFAKKIEEFYRKAPDAPLKKNWPEVVMKRMIRQAIDSGADGLAWTPGRIQAQRYSLSNHVNQVNLIGSTPSGAIILEAYGKADQPVFRKTLSKESEVSEYIGKELADRLLAQTPKKTAGTDSFRSLSGLDLEVGGEGMKAFYDKMLPDFMRSYVKKYGGKLETTEILSDGKKITVPYVRFTPEMKKKITTEGQPLYQVAAPITAGALLKEYIERNREQSE